MTGFVQVTTTSDNENHLLSLAEALVALRLAACVQISGPITSIYRWQGNIERSPEWQCSLKSSETLIDRVKSEIRRLHHYEEPEIVVTPIVDGSESYLDWLANQLEPPTS